MELETPRLLLRVPRREDLDGFAALMAGESAHFIGGPAPRLVAWRGMATIVGSWHTEGFGMFSVVEKATGRWVGRLGPWRPEGWPGPEIGWAIVADARGRGYAVEGAAAAAAWAFDELGWPEIIHCIAPDNVASQRVAARLGSTLRGTGRLPPPLHDKELEIWGQTRHEWRQRVESQATGT
jgi:RimJ/RimL family protein N-acetyltransferase